MAKKKKKAATKKTSAKKTVKKPAKKAKSPAPKKVQAIPAQYSSVIPAFRVPRAAGAVDFLQKVFGAKVKDRYDGPNGALFHAELKIGNTTLMCGDAPEGDVQTLGASLYVKDCDQVFDKAVALGARVKQPITTQFYGDRSGRVIDTWGNEWVIATHVEDVSKKEMQKRMQALSSQPAA